MARTVLLIRGAMGGWSRRTRWAGLGFALAGLWFAACSLNPQPLPPGFTGDVPGGGDDGSLGNGASGSGSSGGGFSSSGGGIFTSPGGDAGAPVKSGSDGGAIDAEAPADAEVKLDASSDAGDGGGGDGGDAGDAGATDASLDGPADATTD